MDSDTFPGFAHTAQELSAYIFFIDVFIISLVSAEVKEFAAPDATVFRAWLDGNGIRDATHRAVSMAVCHWGGGGSFKPFAEKLFNAYT